MAIIRAHLRFGTLLWVGLSTIAVSDKTASGVAAAATAAALINDAAIPIVTALCEGNLGWMS